MRTHWAGADWGASVELVPAGQAVLLCCSWAQVEPECGHYDDEVVERYLKAVRRARQRNVEPVLCLHRGALPDWALARGGWLDPDAGALWGCYVDRIARVLAEMIRIWIVFDGLLEEAAAYGEEAPRVARSLLDAHASAYLLLHRSSGFGGRASSVGSTESYGRWVGEGLRSRLDAALRPHLGPDSVAQVLASGRLVPPFGWVGELPNGTPALDCWGFRWRGVWKLPDGPRQGEDEEACLLALRAAWQWRRPLLLFGVPETVVKRALMEGIRVDLQAEMGGPSPGGCA